MQFKYPHTCCQWILLYKINDIIGILGIWFLISNWFGWSILFCFVFIQNGHWAIFAISKYNNNAISVQPCINWSNAVNKHNTHCSYLVVSTAYFECNLDYFQNEIDFDSLCSSFRGFGKYFVDSFLFLFCTVRTLLLDNM